MKTTYSEFLPAIPTSVPYLICEKCGGRFIIMNMIERDWSYLAAPDFCPRCGRGYKTDYLGMPLKDEEK